MDERYVRKKYDIQVNIGNALERHGTIKGILKLDQVKRNMSITKDYV